MRGAFSHSALELSTRHQLLVLVVQSQGLDTNPTRLHPTLCRRAGPSAPPPPDPSPRNKLGYVLGVCLGFLGVLFLFPCLFCWVLLDFNIFLGCRFS